MFLKIANFFIQNSKLTLVLVIVSLIIGIGSYFLLPKQYNPTIVVPAFQIEIPANGLSASEVKRHITTPVENLVMELEGIDEVFSHSFDNYAGIMAKFQVGVNSEYAKIRLNQKIGENLGLKPLGIGEPIIKSIDPEELSQVTYSINYIGDKLNIQEIQIYLKQIAHLIKEEVKQVNNVTTMNVVGGIDDDIIIELDLDQIIARNTNILQVYEVLQNYNLNMPSGDIVGNEQKVFVGVEGKINKIDEIKKIVISNIGGNPLLLEDIADIRRGAKRIDSHIIHSNSKLKGESVLLGFGKQRGTNAVFVTSNIIDKVEKVIPTLPKDIEIKIIQNEGQTAQNATNMLLVNLFQSVIIVFIILAFYLGTRDAFNTAISIPLTLSLVFLIALLIGDNINKITLFALILVLGMIVDNSTVVVENISRHLKERINTGKSKLDAVLLGVQEVGVGVIMATVTRLLAFGSMFAVGGMMGEYMGPIPKYAIFALLLSLLIALTINPWLSYIGASDIKESDKGIKKKKAKFDPRNLYLNFMKKFINNEKKGSRNRKIFKIIFGITLFAVIIAPIYAGIFKARMLPKSDQNQIYVWIDSSRDTSIDKMIEIEKHMSDFFLNNDNLPPNLDIVDNITSSVGEAFMGDFANLFRGGSNRFFEHQLSTRLNLIPKNEYDGKRITSEKYTIEIRELFRQHMLEVYPDLQIRLLEDPPGPPVMSTFLVNIKGDGNDESMDKFMLHTQSTIKNIAKEYSLEDLGNSISSTYRKININIDNSRASSAGITTNQITNTLGIIFSGIDIGIIRNNEAFSPTSLILSINENQKSSIEDLKNIYLTNPKGEKIPLESIADFEYTFVNPEIITDKRQEVRTIFAEMGDESLIYPVFKLFSIFLSKDFIGENYIIDSWSPYKIDYIGINDGRKYTIEWSGEWELTVDTFRDLGLAMGISLLAIYFLLVGQFASFGIAGIIMITFLLGFFGVFPGFTTLYLLNGEYFSATSMIGIIALAGIVVGNAIILIDYLGVLKKNGLTIEDALLKAGFVRFAPIILTSLTTVFGASTIIGDPVWSGLAWAIIWGLLLSSILTLIVIPIFYYDSQKKTWNECIKRVNSKC